MAREEAERLNRLVGNLLDMTRIEAGALRATEEPYDIQEVISAALDRLGSRLEGRPVTSVQMGRPPESRTTQVGAGRPRPRPRPTHASVPPLSPVSSMSTWTLPRVANLPHQFANLRLEALPLLRQRDRQIEGLPVHRTHLHGER